MIARVLEGEIDAVRTSLDDAVEVVRGSVVSALRAQEGYRYLLLTHEGKALASPRRRDRPGRHSFTAAAAYGVAVVWQHRTRESNRQPN